MILCFRYCVSYSDAQNNSPRTHSPGKNVKQHFTPFHTETSVCAQSFAIWSIHNKAVVVTANGHVARQTQQCGTGMDEF